MIRRAGLTLNAGQKADLAVSFQHLVTLAAKLPRERKLSDEPAFVFLPPMPPAASPEPVKTSPPKPAARHARTGPAKAAKPRPKAAPPKAKPKPAAKPAAKAKPKPAKAAARTARRR